MWVFRKVKMNCGASDLKKKYWPNKSPFIGTGIEKRNAKYFEKEEDLVYYAYVPRLLINFNIIYDKDEWSLFIE